MGERHHNRISEFAAAVRASGPFGHRDSFAESYATPFAVALNALGLHRFKRVTPFWDWRRGTRHPRPWAAHLIANQLEENARAQIELAAKVRQSIGPRSSGAAGAEHWRRYHAKRRAEKEKGAEAPSTGNREP